MMASVGYQETKMLQNGFHAVSGWMMEIVWGFRMDDDVRNNEDESQFPKQISNSSCDI